MYLKTMDAVHAQGPESEVEPFKSWMIKIAVKITNL